ncbi:deoxyribonuclease [Clostridia bacterium]|nr:deoxyribonuclease [Clostridia bacterium]
MLFDSHAHYDDEQFDEDREVLLASMAEHKVGGIVNVAASLMSCRSSIDLANRYDFIYGTIGVHPENISELNEESFAWLEEQAKRAAQLRADRKEKDSVSKRESERNDTQEAISKIVAIGEIGLDYHWEKESEGRKAQQQWFIRQLDLAKRYHFPVIIHSRDAAADTLTILKEHAKDLNCVLHCYSYSKEMAVEFLNLGFYLGIGGVITFKNGKKLREAVEQVPLERILIETDCPYLAPEPYRGKRNSSLYLPKVTEVIAEIKGISTQEVEEATYGNASRFYQL